MLMASTFAATEESNAELFPANFPETDPLYEQLFATHAGPEEESEAAEAMKQMLIQVFDLKPIHVENTTHQPQAGQKTSKKQKHGRRVENDIGGLGWDTASS